MPSILERLSDAVSRLSEQELWAYALVPLVVAVLNGRKMRALLAPGPDFHAGISFGLPLPVTSAWSFVSTPNAGGGTPATGPVVLAAVGLFAVGLVVQGVLLAGYLGGLARELRGESARFERAVRRYLLRFLGFSVLLLFLFLPPVVLVLLSRSLAPLVVVWLLLFFVVGYLVYAAPYLIVLHDASLDTALSRSVSLALDGGPYLRYALGYAGVVVGVSIPATLVVANVPLLGVLLGVVGLAPVGLVFDTATLLFVADLTDADGLGTDGDDGARPNTAALSPEGTAGSP